MLTLTLKVIIKLEIMAKMQSISFRTIGEMLDYLHEDQLELVETLRAFILEIAPDLREKLSYNVPFYKGRKNVCYIWPGAVPWGKQTFDGVILGFAKGYLLSDEHEYLKAENRKYVTSRKFTSLQEINFEILENLLNEAVFLDHEAS
jgi:hypothetical protein